MQFIAISPKRSAYGTGTTVEEAKSNCKKFGGTLNNVVVFQLPEEALFPHVDNFGTICWTWPESYQGPRQVDLGAAVYRRGVKEVVS